MKKTLLFITLIACCLVMQAQVKIPAVYKPSKSAIYHKGWIDFNKNGVMDVYENPNANIEDRIEDLLSQMNMDEKTCQMVTLYGYQRVLKDDLPTPEWKEKIWKDGMGAIDEHLNGFRQWRLPPSENEYCWPASKHAWALNEVQRFFVEETRLGIPVDFTNEGIRGVESFRATNFPTQLGLGHTWNRELINKIGYITGHEAKMLGYTNIYAPILDVARDQRWGRMEEVYGESPYLVAELGIQMVKGLQKDYQVAATAKHYAIYSNNKGGREGYARNDPQISPREVENIHMYPYRRVIPETGLLGVMSSYNDYDGVPIQSSYYWLTTRLRGEFGFKGYVVSDSDAVEYLEGKHHTAKDMKEAVRQSVLAGLNVRCTFRSPDSYVLPLRELVKEGGVSEEVINNRVRDILRVKFLVGLFDSPYQTDLAGADKVVESEDYQQVALEASLQSIVMLKNQDNTLPLQINKVKTIAVCGPNADETNYALTHYGPLAVDVTSVLRGIKEYTAGKANVLYAKGCDLVDEHWPDSEIMDYPLTDQEKADINEAVENAKKADVAVVVLGGGQRTCGENKSRTSIDLPGRQEDLLKAIYATGKPVILVLINGRPLSINWAARNVQSILECWYPGSKGGTAIAEVIFGDYNPGGKLTVTVPKTVGQIPFNFPAKPASQSDGGSGEGLKGNQSRINGPLYPFGFGLSYTTFEYSDIKVSPTVITPDEKATVSFTIKNTGKRAGDEVVQLYVRDMVSSVTTYEKNLAGFDRIHLEAGESKEVSFTIDRKHLELLDGNMHWVVEPGDFNLMVGASSTDIKLQKKLTVIDYAMRESNLKQEKDEAIKEASKLIQASSNTQQIQAVIDGNIKTAWTGKKGDYITFTLKNDQPIAMVKVAVTSKQREEVKFKVQLSSGGGQFLDVYTSKVTPNEFGRLITCNFRETTASDLRILLETDNAGIAEVTFK